VCAQVAPKMQTEPYYPCVPCTYKTGLLKGKGWLAKCVSPSLGVSVVWASAAMCVCSCWDQWRCPCVCTSCPQKADRTVLPVRALYIQYRPVEREGVVRKMCEGFPGCE
jgi:hypothetical protein